MIAYLDTSAAMKLVVEEAESTALLGLLTSAEEFDLVASWLLHTELHCAANRHPDSVPTAAVEQVLDTVTLVDLTRGDLLTAGTLPGGLRSADALHLAVALRVAADDMVTYDAELAAAARSAGLRVRDPR
ncbi:hypothetical protein SAMN05443575_0853 [Jatrophihabitans endophyticus]|uniref:Ribonuclease VapC n=1 Tax=Jatrophihabitans endophyticus TaxID=1206085 RepID=A0A1M5ECS2_9ACTN|nr:type II toxin-antitoxin system VapC family toxin [Jatrophihabitans endophyticus]SHF76960.1 hypothetical protein SAMN05443575_0853 [Jatrophihabitans endophyticus]